jgi:hypothetical protein
MIHPFGLAIDDLEFLTIEGLPTEEIAPSVEPYVDQVVGGRCRPGHGTGCFTPPVLTKAWQEGGQATTLAVGEEGGVTTLAVGEEGGVPYPISRPWSELGSITQSCMETGC